MSAVADVLRAARLVLSKDEWERHVTCPRLVIGEVLLARHAEKDMALRVFAHAIGGACNMDIYAWNDTENRTYSEVLATFDKAIAIAEEQS